MNGSYKSAKKSSNGHKSILVNKLNKTESHAEDQSRILDRSEL